MTKEKLPTKEFVLNKVNEIGDRDIIDYQFSYMDPVDGLMFSSSTGIAFSALSHLGKHGYLTPTEMEIIDVIVSSGMSRFIKKEESSVEEAQIVE